MGFLKRWSWLGVYSGLRLWLILTFPVFNDESIYAWWSRLIHANPVTGMVPILADGKQPGLMILWSIFVNVGKDPVVSLRLVSMVFGMATAVVVFWIYRLMSDREMTWWMKLLYVVTPGLVWFESLALQESAVMCVSTLLVGVSIWVSKRQRWGIKSGVLMGSILALGWWIKPTSLLVGAALVGGMFYERKRSIVTAVFALCIAALGISLIQLHPAAAVFNTVSVHRSNGIALLTKNPSLMISRIWSEIQWLIWWLGPIWCLLFFPAHKRSNKLFIFLGGVSVLGLSLIAGEGIFTARYIASALPLFLLWMVLRLDKPTILVRLVGIVSASLSGLLILSPQTAFRLMSILPATQADFSQYVTGWTSGWGVKDAIYFVKQLVDDKPAIVLVRADAGNPESAVLAYFWQYNRIQVGYVEAAQPLIQAKLSGQLTGIPIYYIARGTQMAGLTETQVRLIRKFPKPLDSEYVAVWEVK